MDVMDRFVSRENIGRYRQLASESIEPAERSLIMRLLAEEVTKFKMELKHRGNASEGGLPVNAATGKETILSASSGITDKEGEEGKVCLSLRGPGTQAALLERQSIDQDNPAEASAAFSIFKFLR